MVKSWDDFENGCIPMHCGANTVQFFYSATHCTQYSDAIRSYKTTSTSALTSDSYVTVI